MHPMKIIFWFASTLFSLNLIGQSVDIPGIGLPTGKLNDTTALALFSTINTSGKNGVFLLDPLIKTSLNTGYARSYNDGAVWKGKGLTSELHGGVMIKKGAISLVLHPVAYHSQNKSFKYPDTLSSINQFAYPFSPYIDWVHRYGNSSFTQIHLGQSELKLETHKFFASVGTQNYSLGPSVFNPILLSTQAGGFPHLRIGIKPTYLTKKHKIAKIDASLIYGLLKESAYFDNNSINDQRYFNGIFIALSPSVIPSLTLGFNRVLHKQTQYFQTQDLISPIIVLDNGVLNGDTLAPNDSFDQMASFSLEWRFPSVDFRTYLEFAKTDFTSDGGGIRPTLVEPEHTRAYTIGFEKSFPTKGKTSVDLIYEHTNLSIGHRGWRPTPPYYTHDVNRQGYTHDGQIIGAGIGTGGNSDQLVLELERENFSVSLLLQRIENNRDYFVNAVRNSNLHDQEYTVGVYTMKEFNSIQLFFDAAISKNYGKYYEFNDVFNFSLGFGLRLSL